jgi:hypothetical protein
MEYKLKVWDFRRNLSKDAWRYIDDKITKRKLEGKDSDVILSGVRIKKSRIQKETSRNRWVSTLEKYKTR